MPNEELDYYLQDSGLLSEEELAVFAKNKENFAGSPSDAPTEKEITDYDKNPNDPLYCDEDDEFEYKVVNGEVVLIEENESV